MKALDRVVDRTDQWQQHNRVAAPTYAVIKKFGDDQANDLVVGLGWYGFTSIYPLLLVVVTIFGFVGAASLGNGIVSTLHQFPVIGSEFNPAKGSSRLHGNVAGLVVGLVLLVYGAQGVTQTAQRAMAKVWDIPKKELPGFLARLDEASEPWSSSVALSWRTPRWAPWPPLELGPMPSVFPSFWPWWSSTSFPMPSPSGS